MIRIGLLGYSGRMGQAIAKAIGESDACTLVSGCVRQMKPFYDKVEGVFISTNADEVIAACDIAIDFTLADATPIYAQLAAAHKKPFVTGTTGLTSVGEKALQDAAKKIPILQAANTSLSLAAMKQVTALAAKLLAPFDYDVAITDEHHKMKMDAPSGTAKALGEVVMKANSGKHQPGYSSVRAGSIVGEHEVIFTGNGETIRLRHSVTDRNVFARGAVQAALWLHGKPAGFYGMDDVLGIESQTKT